jgi:hypothetical protein
MLPPSTHGPKIIMEKKKKERQRKETEHGQNATSLNQEETYNFLSHPVRESQLRDLTLCKEKTRMVVQLCS